MNPHDVLAISGTQAVQDYLIQEVQKVYRRQGVDINDKHSEVIVRQMMKKVRVEEGGDTPLLPSSVVEKTEFEAENEKIRERIANGESDLREATCTPVLLGITKASLEMCIRDRGEGHLQWHGGDQQFPFLRRAQGVRRQ